jgi:hypothetical protein
MVVDKSAGFENLKGLNPETTCQARNIGKTGFPKVGGLVR